jgi:hypothetical protein
MRTVILTKEYTNEHGNIKPIGTAFTCREEKIKELAVKGVIEIDKRFKEPKAKRSKIIIENTNIEK